MKNRISLVAMDLDGTLTQHKQPLTPENRDALERLAAHAPLVIVGAGQVMRIFRQLEGFPIDIIGNYGMQLGRYDRAARTIRMERDETVPCDRPSVDARVRALRETFGLTEFRGENAEFHPSGCVTFPCLGTAARPEDKLAFDPDRTRRRRMYAEVCRAFGEYNVFIGGSSSFDLAPKPYDKRSALEQYCRETGIDPGGVVCIGDDYGPGGNDESLLRSEFAFLPVDDYRTFPALADRLLRGDAPQRGRTSCKPGSRCSLVCQRVKKHF